MRDEKLFLEFINFCESQPEDKEIDHNGTFYDCAVGDFMREMRRQLETYQATDFAHKLLGFSEELYEKVNCAFKYPELFTYGGYTKFLKEYL